MGKETPVNKATKILEQQTQAMAKDLGQLADDASALMSATAGIAGDEIEQARKRVGAALERGRQLYGHVRHRAAEGARVADEVIHEHPYQSIALGVGVGALLGYLLARRCSRSGD